MQSYSWDQVMACERELMPARAEGGKQALNRDELEHTYLYHVFKAYLFLALYSHTATNK